MIVYAESSAVLAWLLNEADGHEVARTLREAEHVVVSELLFVECHRACIRAEHLGALPAEQAAAVRSRLARAGAHWDALRISSPVLERSRQPFPAEPIRSLDAIHLASAVLVQGKLPGISMVSLDQRIRDNAVRLGFEVLPG